MALKDEERRGGGGMLQFLVLKNLNLHAAEKSKQKIGKKKLKLNF